MNDSFLIFINQRENLTSQGKLVKLARKRAMKMIFVRTNLLKQTPILQN